MSDIYTMRGTPDGKVVLVVDSETDYDRNGRIEGEREQRTPIGKPYPEVTPEIERALRGEAVERPPVWAMRQAGRCMKVYRDMCKVHKTFRERSENAGSAA